MSWSVSATGKAKDVARDIARQITQIKLTDEGEMETVRNAGTLLAQTVTTFDESKIVKASASGSMGFSDWTRKLGAYQNVSLNIEAIHLTANPEPEEAKA